MAIRPILCPPRSSQHSASEMSSSSDAVLHAFMGYLHPPASYRRHAGERVVGPRPRRTTVLYSGSTGQLVQYQKALNPRAHGTFPTAGRHPTLRSGGVTKMRPWAGPFGFLGAAAS